MPPAEVHTLPGLTVTVLAPDVSGLERLLEHWPEVVEEGSSGTEPGDLPGDALGDDDDFPLDSLDELLRTRYRRDPSAANGSSIAVLLTADDGARVLLGADAPAEPLVAALQPLTANLGRVPVDLCKLPHHGSAGNVSPALLAALDCRQWLVSTNGGPRGRYPSPVAASPGSSPARTARPSGSTTARPSPTGSAARRSSWRGLRRPSTRRRRRTGSPWRWGRADGCSGCRRSRDRRISTRQVTPHPHVRTLMSAPVTGGAWSGQERRRLPRRDR